MVRRRPPTPTDVFDTYWRFAAERMAVYLRRLAGEPWPWTGDSTISAHRFTNAYRVLDRVSQYLIARVAAEGDGQPREVFFRTILFKVFNRIDTWELLQREIGELRWSEYSYEVYDGVLTAAMARGQRIYSPAYIMPTAAQWGEGRKHRNHLRMIEAFMRDRLYDRLALTSTMAEAFEVFRGYPSIGDFLAYQLVTDVNYTGICDFDEMEFVMPGPGARDGIAKCFASLGDYSETDVVRMAAETQREEFERRGIPFTPLPNRPLQLIDCQNLFCEVDKYARVVHPGVVGRTGRTRIKQRFRAAGPIPAPVFPASWGVSIDPATAARQLAV